MSLRALVADDDPEMLELVCTILARELGADVERASSGHELLALIADHDYDLIVTDISMPWMTGLQVMHSARTAGLPVPVVVMTALRDPDLGQRVSSLGSRARLLYKPFSYEDLIKAVREVERAA